MAFSIIEVLIGIFVFTLGLLSVYMLLMTSLNINEYNKNSIIASNLAREQIELFRNIRDTNYTKLNVWNQRNPNEEYDDLELFTVGQYYSLENDFSVSASFPTKFVNITSGFEEGESKVQWISMKSYQLCLTPAWEYVYCSGYAGTKREIPFFRYLYLNEARDENNIIIPDAFHITSKVIWNIKGYHEYDIKTIVTDWRRI